MKYIGHIALLPSVNSDKVIICKDMPNFTTKFDYHFLFSHDENLRYGSHSKIQAFERKTKVVCKVKEASNCMSFPHIPKPSYFIT